MEVLRRELDQFGKPSPQAIKSAGLFDWAAITDVGAAHAAFNDVVQTLVDHVTAYAKAGHQRASCSPQIMSGPLAARQFQGLAFFAPALYAPVFIFLSVCQLLAKTLDAHRA